MFQRRRSLSGTFALLLGLGGACGIEEATAPAVSKGQQVHPLTGLPTLPLRTRADLNQRSPCIPETFYRLKSARVLWADYALLMEDFPELDHLAGDQNEPRDENGELLNADTPEGNAAWKRYLYSWRKLDQWLQDNAAVISKRQSNNEHGNNAGRKIRLKGGNPEEAQGCRHTEDHEGGTRVRGRTAAIYVGDGEARDLRIIDAKGIGVPSDMPCSRNRGNIDAVDLLIRDISAALLVHEKLTEQGLPGAVRPYALLTHHLTASDSWNYILLRQANGRAPDDECLPATQGTSYETIEETSFDTVQQNFFIHANKSDLQFTDTCHLIDFEHYRILPSSFEGALLRQSAIIGAMSKAKQNTGRSYVHFHMSSIQSLLSH